ncbi:UBX domain-containing protein 2 [Monosporozyma servazzii]
MPTITTADKEYHLSHEEEDKLNQFQAVTDFPEEELSLIIKLLRNHGWNLEAALSRYFDGNWKDNIGDVASPSPTIMPIPSPSSPRPTVSPTLPPYELSRSNSVTPLFQTRNLIPSLPIINRLPADYKSKFQMVGLNNGKTQFVTHNKELLDNTQNTQNIFYLIVLFIPHSIVKIFSILWSMISKVVHYGNGTGRINKPKIFRLPKCPSQAENQIDLDSLITKQSKNGNDDITLSNVKEIVGDVHERKPFNELLDICEREFKFLLVILLGDLEDIENNDINSKKFLNYVLGDDGVMRILRDYKENLLVYVGSVTEIEPWLVAKQLHVKYTPECFMIGNVLNSNGSVNGTIKLSVLNKLKITAPRRLQNSLKNVFDRYNGELVVSRTEKEDLRIAREIKHLQEQAYEESLLKDQLKEEQKQLKLQEMEKIKMEEITRQTQLKLKETYKHLNWLSNCIDILKEDVENYFGNSQQHANNAMEKGKYTTLQFRTSKGNRIIRKFVKDATLHSIYVNIGCHLYLQNNSLDTEEWTQSIVKKIQELGSDDSVLCFKDTELLMDEIDTVGLDALIEEELTRLGKLRDETGSRDTKPFEIEFNFELVSPFPRYRVPVEENVTVKEVSQLWPNGSLLVEDIIEEEEEDDDEGEEEE